MFTFREFLSEKVSHNVDVEMYVHPDDPEQHSIRVTHTAINEVLTVDPNAPDTLGGGIHRALSKFRPTPAALSNPDELTRQFHLHLWKNGYYSDAQSHPVVLNPREQAFKAGWKAQLQGRPGKHQRYHQDLKAYNPDKPPSRSSDLINPTTAVWSTRSPTKISASKDDKDQVPYSSTAGNIHVFDDSKAYHRAANSGDAPNPNNRHFIRATGIRRLPPGGLAALGFAKEVKTGLGGEGTRMGDDFDAYMKSKRPNNDNLRSQVRAKLKVKPDETDEEVGKRKRLGDWVNGNFPEFHPDHPDNQTKPKVQSK